MAQEITITAKEIRSATPRFVEIYKQTRFGGSNNPDDTVKTAVSELGYELTAAMIATWVNEKAWDGRISRGNAGFASSVPGALSENDARDHYVFFPEETIHACHLDQICSTLRKYEKERSHER